MSEQAGSSGAMPVALLSWKPMVKNTLRGFASVRIGKAMKVSDITIHRSGERCWASFPSKPVIDANGVAKRNEQGKVQYTPILEWTDRDTADRFSDAVIAAVQRDHPGDTGE